MNRGDFRDIASEHTGWLEADTSNDGSGLPTLLREDFCNNNRQPLVQATQECKVIILGDGAAGKSSLIERIVHNRFEERCLPTDGFKMTKWSVDSNGNPLTLDSKPLTLRLLDFGGQEIMHYMHRCFMTNHTIYVVVCESRNGPEIDEVAVRWMETVRYFAPKCPVILALSKSDLNPNASVNERELKRINPQYRCMIRFSSKAKNDSGIQNLIQSILREVPGCLYHMHIGVGFLGIKKVIENMTANYILPFHFQRLCEHFQIQKDMRDNLLNWFQYLGVAYPYYTTRGDVYVLTPAWLTNGIYRLILNTPRSGFLRHSEIPNILSKAEASDGGYSTQNLELILCIMRQFELSVSIAPEMGIGDGVEMIPMMMEKTAPSRYDRFPRKGALHIRWEDGHLPISIVQRLIVRKYAELDPSEDLERKCVWRTGGWFRSLDGCDALVEAESRAIDVYVSGEHGAQAYMDSFRRQISSILRQHLVQATEFLFVSVNGIDGKVPYQNIKDSYLSRKKAIDSSDIHEDMPKNKLMTMNALVRDASVCSDMDTRDCFISYNNQFEKNNGYQASWITKILQDNGYTVFFQKKDCTPGMSFPRWMAEAIEHSRVFLALWSRAYEESIYCRDELEAAYVRRNQDSRFSIIPVRVEDVPIRNPLFARIVHVDVFSPDEEMNQMALLNAVRNCLHR